MVLTKITNLKAFKVEVNLKANHNFPIAIKEIVIQTKKIRTKLNFKTYKKTIRYSKANQIIYPALILYFVPENK